MVSLTAKAQKKGVHLTRLPPPNSRSASLGRWPNHYDAGIANVCMYGVWPTPPPACKSWRFGRNTHKLITPLSLLRNKCSSFCFLGLSVSRQIQRDTCQGGEGFALGAFRMKACGTRKPWDRTPTRMLGSLRITFCTFSEGDERLLASCLLKFAMNSD